MRNNFESNFKLISISIKKNEKIKRFDKDNVGEYIDYEEID